MHVRTTVSGSTSQEENNELVVLSLDLLDEKREATRLRNWSYQKDVAKTYNKKVRTRTFQQRDWILRRAEKTTGKHTPGWERPYKVIEVRRADAYRLQDSKGTYELDQVSRDLQSWPALTKSGTTTVARPQRIKTGMRHKAGMALQQGGSLDYETGGEIPSSNNLRLQNLVESQLEVTKTESCLIALSAKFVLKKLTPCASRLGLLIYSLQVCKLAGFLKTLEYWPRDKFWDLVSGCLILCLEMLETSLQGSGQDLGLITTLGGAMTTLAYVSRIIFDLIPSRIKVRVMFSAYVTCMVGIEQLFEDNF
ncbi:hypothetical protein F2Q69_00006848 [Brassica cretica]|uniref:Uncharacterized protein n=1 Tax=Brassica cretica TaxID=69181 RepID=A0A8S9P2H4_BRACR|nr:hypothetical protein F2Q69_00006848 [Brassica cretica]